MTEMKNEEKKVKKYYRGKRNPVKQKYVAITIIAVILIVALASIIIFKPFGNKEKASDDKKKEVSKEVQTEDGEKIEAKPVDETVLKNLITNAEAIQTAGYTEESVVVFNTALEEARNLLQTNFEQTQVEAACKKLVDAIQQLTKQ